jgi:integration host factor subunit beta
MVPGKQVPHFKAGKELRERVDSVFLEQEQIEADDQSSAFEQLNARVRHG